MREKNIIKLPEEKFRRITGVKKTTFYVMVDAIEKALVKKKEKGGRPNKLSPVQMVLMTLEYLREYKTYASIGLSYGVSESVAYKIIKWVEECLVRNDNFKLPGRKALLKSDNKIEIVLIDVTESPIERPKKNKSDIIQERKNVTLKKCRLL
jgi:hypothetical protein